MQMFPGNHLFLNGKESNGILEVISRKIKEISGKTKRADTSISPSTSAVNRNAK